VVIRAETREEMEVATRALDRVLRAYRIRVPQWFNDSAWVAYYNTTPRRRGMRSSASA
jgi:microcin C transport system substrate-binding protein